MQFAAPHLTGHHVPHPRPMKIPLVVIALSALFVPNVRGGAPPKVLFEEKFQGRLDGAWQWLRERPEAWRIADGALVIDTLPGSYWMKQNNSQNTLLRPALVSLENGFIVEVLLDNQPVRQFEHAGLLLYFDGENVVALNKEALRTPSLVVVSEQDGKPSATAPFPPRQKNCSSASIPATAWQNLSARRDSGTSASCERASEQAVEG